MRLTKGRMCNNILQFRTCQGFCPQTWAGVRVFTLVL